MIILLIILSYLFLALNFGAPERVSNISDGILVLEHTVVLLICYIIINNHFNKKSLQSRYYLFFLISYCLSLIYMFSEWGNNLYVHYSTGWDTFDPIKYFALASESIKRGYILEEISIFPVSYVYYAVMQVFGVNPLVPLFFNEVVFVYAICILSRLINVESPIQIRYYSWLMLIPEVISFNATSSKDIVCLLCATIIFVKSSELLQKSFSMNTVIVIIITFVIFTLSRVALAMASIVGILLVMMSMKKISKKTILISSIAVVLIFMVFAITGDLAISAEGISARVNTFLSGDVSNASELAGQSSESFARVIIPHNSIEFIVFGIIRSVCYIVIDPRFIRSPQNTLFPIDGYSMRLLVDYTTLLMFISCFYIFFWIKNRWKKEDVIIKELFVVCALYWYAVGTFNPLMIHVRYRVVYDVLFFTIALRAYLCTRRKTKRKDIISRKNEG